MHTNFMCIQGLDKTIETLVKFKESLFNMELGILQPTVQLQLV